MKPLISVKLVSIYDRAPYRKAVVRFRRASNRLYVRMVLLLCAGGAAFFLSFNYRRDLAWASFAACYLTSFALYPRWLRIHARINRLIDHANVIGLRQIQEPLDSYDDGDVLVILPLARRPQPPRLLN